MAQMYPTNPPDTNIYPELRAEKDVFVELQRQLPNQFRVYHDRKWRESGRIKQDNQADFIIVHRELGCLVIEVKGGIISASDGAWYTTQLNDRKAVAHKLDKSPWTQVLDNKYSLKRKLESNEDYWRRRIVHDSLGLSGKLGSSRALLKELDRRTTAEQDQIDKLRTILTGKPINYKLHHAVIFPDTDFEEKGLVSFELDPDPICKRDMGNLLEIIVNLMSVGKGWDIREPSPARRQLAQKFLKSALTVELPGSYVELVSESTTASRHLELLEEQLHAKDPIIRANTRLLITGGAGTGKTAYAQMVAREFAESDLKVLLLCYNSLLRSSLEEKLSSFDNIKVDTFEGLRSEIIQAAGRLTGQQIKEIYATHEAESVLSECFVPSLNQFKREAEDNFLETIADLADDEINEQIENRVALHASPYEYDVVIVDEAQDFMPEWLEAIPQFLANAEHGRSYYFVDDNQNIYRGTPSLLGQRGAVIAEIPLEINIRNTKEIHGVVREFYKPQNSRRYIANNVSGPQIKYVTCEQSAIYTEVSNLLSEMIGHHRVAPADIVILSGRGKDKSSLVSQVKFAEGRVLWLDGLNDVPDAVVPVSTIRSFKGLERRYVILCELDGLVTNPIDEDDRRRLVYTAVSRAQTYLAAVGSTDELELLSN